MRRSRLIWIYSDHTNDWRSSAERACAPMRRILLGAALSAALLSLGACSSQPRQSELSTTAPTVPTVDRGSMAPIANPELKATLRRKPSSPTKARKALAAPSRQAVTAAPTPSAKLRANALRAQGLEKLNLGQVDHAVSLLRHAGQLDPQNPLIERDLARALRISKAVRNNS